eukprot:Gregarina_sp_Poly_1__5662@NODE_298_length_9826_cov_182_594221_g257_i0_p2_GENE_NODE_298_length_9826_cov_182_594221_g257_i0NODE_298_length_9826_cov_182_594221_g257_i0_p2_ORF_typecomplete_len836_score72_46SGL/PF08450_12/0_014SGL/PF08450_12/7_9e02Lactonase/PF10282_9/0_0054PQQ_2/PF13360_6/0_54_NODE_298_length_9826_cov_182_594221_g257_i01582665
MSRIHNLSAFALITALVVYVFLFTTDGVIREWLTKDVSLPSFSQFGVLFSNIANYSVFYIDYEWLLLDGRSSPQTDPSTANNNSPFVHPFPFYAYYGEKPEFSIEAEHDLTMNATRLFYSSSLLGEISVLYVCNADSPIANPVIVRADPLITNVKAPRKVRVWTALPDPELNDPDLNVTFMSYIADTTVDDDTAVSALYVGVLKPTDFLTSRACQRGQQRLRRVRFVPLGYRPLSGCSQPLDYTSVQATQRLASEYLHTRTTGYALFLLACPNFFRVMRLTLTFPSDLFINDGGGFEWGNGLSVTDDMFIPPGGPTGLPECELSPLCVLSADWVTEANTQMSLASSAYTVKGTEGLNTWIYVASLTSAGPVLRACDAFTPDLWAVRIERLREWRCRQYLLKATQIPTSIQLTPNHQSLLLTFYLRGLSRVSLVPRGCETCGNPSFHRSVETLLDRFDGVVGDPYITLMNPASCAFDNDGRILYFIDATDGFVRWTTAHDDGDLIAPAELLWTPSRVLKAPRSVSRSVHLNKLVVADWTGKAIYALNRNQTTYKLSLSPLVNTTGNPFDLDAATDGNMVFWSEPAQDRICRAIWGDGKTMAEKARIWLRGKTVAGVSYSSYFARVFAASPRAGEILSVNPRDDGETSIIHFSSSHSATSDPRFLLRPLYLAVDDNWGSLYFNVLAAPNISAYSLSEPDLYTAVDNEYYLRPPPANITNKEYGYNLASTIWLMKKRPFSTSLLYQPRPFYTNPEAIILSITRNDDWLVFVETPIDVNANFSARIGRLQLLSSTDEAFSLNWRVRVCPHVCEDVCRSSLCRIRLMSFLFWVGHLRFQM